MTGSPFRRLPWLAALLGFFPGAGQLYAGWPQRALVVFGIELVAGLVWIIALGMQYPRVVLALALPYLLWRVAIVIDAWRLARRRPRRLEHLHGGRLAVAVVGMMLLQVGARSLQQTTLRRVAGDSFRMPSAGMEPTVLAGDRIFAAVASRDDVALGALCIFAGPDGLPSVKRLVAVAGDTIEMRQGVLVRNGERVTESLPPQSPIDGALHAPEMLWQRAAIVGPRDTSSYVPTLADWGPLLVPPGHSFVLGDNRANSVDSRIFGFVADSAISHRPSWVYFSWEAGRGVRWERIGVQYP